MIKKINYSVRFRVIVPVMLSLTIMISTFAIGFHNYKFKQYKNINEFSHEIVEKRWKELLLDCTSKSLAAMSILSTDDLVLNRFSRASDDENLNELFSNYSYQYGISNICFYSNDGKVIEILGDNKVAYSYPSYVIKSATTQQTTFEGLELSPAGKLYYKSATPIWRNERIEGYLSLAIFLSPGNILEGYVEGLDIVQVLQKRYLKKEEFLLNKDLQFEKSKWGEFQDIVFASDLPISKVDLNRLVYDPDLESRVILANKKGFLASSLAVSDTFGDKLIKMLILTDVTYQRGQFKTYWDRYLILTASLMSVLLVFFWWYLGRVEIALDKANKDLSQQVKMLEKARDELSSNEISLKAEVAQRREFENKLESQVVELDSARQAAWSMMEDFYEARQKTELANKRLKQTMEHAKFMAQEADKANVAKSQFLANMSHEIRTPMNAIIGFADLLKMGTLDEQQADYIATIVSSGQHLLCIINDILDISKVEAGELKLEKSPFDPVSLCDQIVRSMDTHVNKEKVKLKLSFSKEIPSTLIGDSTRLRQIIQNIVANATKFTHEGFVLLSLGFDGYEFFEAQRMCRLLIEVKDTGIGISEDKLEMIFEPFNQADSSTTRRYGGTGLGLSIVKHFVDAMNGQVDVVSCEGQGTEFKVIIPLQMVD